MVLHAKESTAQSTITKEEVLKEHLNTLAKVKAMEAQWKTTSIPLVAGTHSPPDKSFSWAWEEPYEYLRCTYQEKIGETPRPALDEYGFDGKQSYYRHGFLDTNKPLRTETTIDKPSVFRHTETPAKFLSRLGGVQDIKVYIANPRTRITAIRQTNKGKFVRFENADRRHVLWMNISKGAVPAEVHIYRNGKLSMSFVISEYQVCELAGEKVVYIPTKVRKRVYSQATGKGEVDTVYTITNPVTVISTPWV